MQNHDISGVVSVKLGSLMLELCRAEAIINQLKNELTEAKLKIESYSNNTKTGDEEEKK